MATKICPKCNTYMEKNHRDQLECPSCGYCPEQVALKKGTPARSATDNRQSEIRNKIYAHPQYGYALRLTDWLYEQYGIEHKRTIFRNRQVSSMELEHYGDTKPQIVYGYESIQRSAESGFYEYKTLRYLMPREKLDGLRGVHQVVLHEFAHVLQNQIPGGLRRGSHHNDCFVRCYKELMTLVPFGEFPTH